MMKKCLLLVVVCIVVLMGHAVLFPSDRVTVYVYNDTQDPIRDINITWGEKG